MQFLNAGRCVETLLSPGSLVGSLSSQLHHVCIRETYESTSPASHVLRPESSQPFSHAQELVCRPLCFACQFATSTQFPQGNPKGPPSFLFDIDGVLTKGKEVLEPAKRAFEQVRHPLLLLHFPFPLPTSFKGSVLKSSDLATVRFPSKAPVLQFISAMSEGNTKERDTYSLALERIATRHANFCCILFPAVSGWRSLALPCVLPDEWGWHDGSAEGCPAVRMVAGACQGRARCARMWE